MQTLQFGSGGRLVADAELVVLVVEKPPELAHEAVGAFDALHIPGLGLLQWAKEHFIETQSVGAIFLHQIVGVLHVEFGLGHFLNL